MSDQRHCCQIECAKDAEWEIWTDAPYDGIDSCTEHVGALLSDAPVHYAYRIYPVGTELGTHERRQSLPAQ